LFFAGLIIFYVGVLLVRQPVLKGGEAELNKIAFGVMLAPTVGRLRRLLLSSEAGRGARGVHGCLVAGAARPPRTLCGPTRPDGTAGVGRIPHRFRWHLPDRSHRKLRFPRAGLAKQSPAVLDSINQYVPVVIINGLAAILFMIGYVLFGVAMIRTAALPRWSGVLVALGAPAHLLGFGIAQLVSTAAWPIAILGSVSLGAGLAWPGYRLWRAPTASDVVVSDKSRRA
jgi:hypothetical protein